MDVFKYSAQADTNLVAANGTFKGFFCYRHTRAMDAGTLETKPEFWLRLLSSICQESVETNCHSESLHSNVETS